VEDALLPKAASPRLTRFRVLDTRQLSLAGTTTPRRYLAVVPDFEMLALLFAAAGSYGALIGTNAQAQLAKARLLRDPNPLIAQAGQL
jgi:hypothetical protein